MASQIVTLSGLTRLKSALGSKYDMLSLIDIRASTLWISLDGGILSCQKRTVQDNAYTTSNKSFSIQKLIPQAEGWWTIIKMITVGKAQRTKGMTRTIFYRWYGQWILSKSVKVQQSSKWGKFNIAQIKAVDGRSSPRLKTPHSTWRLSMMPRKLWRTILWYFAFLRLTVPSTPVILSLVETSSRHKNAPLLVIWHWVAGCCCWRALISE